jgi:hypothetical protein
MKKPALFSLATIASLFASGCTTQIGADGQPHQVMTPLGAAAVQAVTAAGIGAGTGALLKGVNPVAAGAISAGAGSIGSQAINAFIPKASSQGGAPVGQPPAQQVPANTTLYVRTSEGTFVPAKIRYVQQPDGSYVPSYPRGRQLFRQLPNGAFAPVN